MNDLDLIGKFLTLALTADEARDLTLVPSRSDARTSPYWVLGGTIKGQTRHLGLWIEVSTIQDAKGAEVPRSENMGLLLLPWSAIRRAILRDRKPEQIAPVGFPPSAK